MHYPIIGRPLNGTLRPTMCRQPTPRPERHAIITTAIAMCSSVVARSILPGHWPPYDASYFQMRASPLSKNGSKITGMFLLLSINKWLDSNFFLMHPALRYRYGVLFIAVGFITIIVSCASKSPCCFFPKFLDNIPGMLFIKIMKRVKERPDSANNKKPSRWVFLFLMKSVRHTKGGAVV